MLESHKWGTKMDDELLDSAGVAAFLKVKPRTVLEEYALLPVFPKPVLLPGGTTRPRKRWFRSDIVKFAQSQRMSG